MKTHFSKNGTFLSFQKYSASMLKKLTLFNKNDTFFLFKKYFFKYKNQTQKQYTPRPIHLTYARISYFLGLAKYQHISPKMAYFFPFKNFRFYVAKKNRHISPKTAHFFLLNYILLFRRKTSTHFPPNDTFLSFQIFSTSTQFNKNNTFSFFSKSTLNIKI